MPTRIRLLLASLFLAMGLASAADRPAFSSLERVHKDLLTRWLRQDCGVGIERKKLVAQMISAGPVLEKALWEAYDLGPTLKEREEFQSTLGDRWLLRYRWLMVRGKEAIGSERTQELLAESEEQFRINEDVNQLTRWRDAAVSGLGLVCTERSVVRLQAMAKDPKSASSIAALTALKTSENCSPRHGRPERSRPRVKLTPGAKF